ncbi:AraC family transcriptional regulator N-terminal domain-containing protein [Glaesserella parasuis]|uniref:AraC family transcriptional regulator N-terminal domain-containing protein n=1 Tax=Glaesserella parasuis TaxID=738 RepID=UPI00271B09AB|nr:AraC family transcriptional regulator N-terminal domain-containing protein [Glaesserella parasuis]MDP0383923.1 AraC family transcriptional regulator N-terminal domain-containing protein [Glaesserella parasuis]
MHTLIQEMLGFLQKDEALELPEVGLTLYRCDTPIPQVSYLQEPAVCFILRGQKNGVLGRKLFKLWRWAIYVLFGGIADYKRSAGSE